MTWGCSDGGHGELPPDYDTWLTTEPTYAQDNARGHRRLACRRCDAPEGSAVYAADGTWSILCTDCVAELDGEQ